MQKVTQTQVILNEDDIKEAISEKYHIKPSEIVLESDTDDFGEVISISASFYEENTWDMAMRISQETANEKL